MGAADRVAAGGLMARHGACAFGAWLALACAAPGAHAADALVADLGIDQVWRFLKHTTIETQATIFEYFHRMASAHGRRDGPRTYGPSD